jgi:hypothetical protein
MEPCPITGEELKALLDRNVEDRWPVYDVIIR